MNTLDAFKTVGKLLKNISGQDTPQDESFGFNNPSASRLQKMLNETETDFNRGCYLNMGTETFRQFIKLGLEQTSNIGYKLHVTARPDNAADVFSSIRDLLQNVNHKVVSTEELLRTRMTGTQEGKFITIYPNSDQESVFIARAIDERLSSKGFNNAGPKIKFDAPLNNGKSGMVFYTYTNFTGEDVVNPYTGEIIKNYDDKRRAGRIGSVPPWVPQYEQNPFEAGASKKVPSVQNEVERFLDMLRGSVNESDIVNAKSRIRPPVSMSGQAYTISDVNGQTIMFWTGREAYFGSQNGKSTFSTPLQGDAYIIGRKDDQNTRYFKISQNKISERVFKDEHSNRGRSRLQILIIPGEQTVIYNIGQNDIEIVLLKNMFIVEDYVRDESGNPVSNATVQLTTASGNVYTAVTDENGHFKIIIKEGKTDYSIEVLGYTRLK